MRFKLPPELRYDDGDVDYVKYQFQIHMTSFNILNESKIIPFPNQNFKINKSSYFPYNM